MTARFSHFRVRNADGSVSSRGGASFAYQDVGDDLYAAAAYCSPRDNFAYKSARIKTTARLNNLIANPKKEDGNTYFIIPIKNGDVASAQRALADTFIEGFGFSPRYVKKDAA